MKIIVDAMGGDNAPLEIVRGALAANRDHGVEIILVGRTAEVLKAVEACGQKSLPAGCLLYTSKWESTKAAPFRRRPDPELPPGLRAVESVTAGLQRPVFFYL